MTSKDRVRITTSCLNLSSISALSGNVKGKPVKCGNQQKSKDFEDVYLAASFYTPFIWSKPSEMLSCLFICKLSWKDSNY